MNILTRALALGAVLAFCGISSADTVNIIGDSTTTKTPSNFVGSDSALGNGDFEAETGNPVVFSSVTGWHNLAGDETVNFGRSNGTVGSPQ